MQADIQKLLRGWKTGNVQWQIDWDGCRAGGWQEVRWGAANPVIAATTR